MARKKEKEIKDEDRLGKSRGRTNSKRILLEEGRMENLNSDMVLEILTRLPIESVLQCRKVCKLWRNLLGKPKTGTLFAHSPGHGVTELYYREQTSPTVSLNSTEEKENIYLVGLLNTPRSFCLIGSCNGLVCYKTSESQICDYDIYIFNPITGEQIRLPNSQRRRIQCKMYRPRYSQCLCNEFVGFGYCLSTKKYKVVIIGYLNEDKIYERVYTLGDGNWWREREIRFDTKMFNGCRALGVFANGALHWLNKRSNRNIIVFDLADDTIRFLASPPGHIHCGSYKNVCLCSLEGNLCLSYMKHSGLVDIWVFKKHNFRLKELNSFTWTKVISRKWDSKAETPLSLNDSEILLWEDGVLSCYDPATFKKLWYEVLQVNVEAIPHMNSLVSLQDLGENLVEKVSLLH